MSHKVMEKESLCRLGSEQIEGALFNEHMAFTAGLDAMEREGWTLVHVVPQARLWDEEGMPNGFEDVQYVFHRPTQTVTKVH